MNDRCLFHWNITINPFHSWLDQSTTCWTISEIFKLEKHDQPKSIFEIIPPSIHAFSAANPDPVRGGSSLTKVAQMSFYLDTSFTSSWGIQSIPRTDGIYRYSRVFCPGVTVTGCHLCFHWFLIALHLCDVCIITLLQLVLIRCQPSRRWINSNMSLSECRWQRKARRRKREESGELQRVQLFLLRPWWTMTDNLRSWSIFVF